MSRPVSRLRMIVRRAGFALALPLMIVVVALERGCRWLMSPTAPQGEPEFGDQGGMPSLPVLPLRGGTRPASDARRPAGTTPDSASRLSPRKRLAAFYENEGL